MQSSWRVAVLAGLLVLPMTATASWAGFKVCNRSDERINVSIGYQNKEYGWTSEGWWSIEPDNCHSIITGQLDQRYYYVYAIGADGGLWAASKGEQDGGFFCLGKAKYTFHNRDYQSKNEIDCEAGGQQTKQFLEVDTDNATDFTYSLKN